MEDDQGSQYRTSFLTEQERAQAEERERQNCSGLTEEELDAQIDRTLAGMDELCIRLGACGGVVVDRLQQLIQGVTKVAVSLTAMDAPWAQLHGNELLKAAHEAVISPRDREGKVLLGLPKRGDEAAFLQWLSVVRSSIENGDWLGAACGYGVARTNKLVGVAVEAAIALAAIEHPEAQASAIELRRFAAWFTAKKAGPSS